jgi:hypothetical protein
MGTGMVNCRALMFFATGASDTVLAVILRRRPLATVGENTP